MPDPGSPLSRRRLLGVAGGLALGALTPGVLAAREAPFAAAPPRPRERTTGTARHLAWVWQFRHDGDPAAIRDTLAAHGLGIVLKTHDGAEWMSRYDPTKTAVDGPARVAEYARFFEDAGVPFHAWAVVKGNRVDQEVEIASAVLDSGARSLFLDLEAHAGFWVGSRDDATRYAEALRRAQPSARLSISIDARPWEIDRIPLAEFAAVSDEISPQLYWGLFANRANQVKYELAGDVPGPDGVTPTFVVQSAMKRLETFGLPVHPIGDGTVLRDPAWPEFLERSFEAKAEAVSVWRYGVADPAIWEFLRDNPARPAMQVYVVASGDSLGAIAARFGTSVDAIARDNGITNPNLIRVGQELRIGGVAPTATTGGGTTARPAGGTYEVQPGDTLSQIAERFGTTTVALQAANGITNAHAIRIGDVLRIP